MTKIDVKTVEGYKIVMAETTGVDVLKLIGFVALAFVSIFVSLYMYMGRITIGGYDYTLVVIPMASLVGLMIVMGTLAIFYQRTEKYFAFPAYEFFIEGENISTIVPKPSNVETEIIVVCNAVQSLEAECRRLVKEKRDMQKIVLGV